MAIGSIFANDLAKLIANGVAIANIADNAGVSPLTNLYWSLHTGDPSAGNQTTNEATYPGYSRVSVLRSGAGLVATNNVINPTAAVTFPESSGGTETYTHAALGTAASGTGKIIASGPISPNIPIAASRIPQLKTTTAVTIS